MGAMSVIEKTKFRIIEMFFLKLNTKRLSAWVAVFGVDKFIEENKKINGKFVYNWKKIW